MSATSQPKKSATTKNDLPPTEADVLQMLQAAMNKAAEIPGVEVLATTVNYQGKETAAVVLPGCVWSGGRLVLATPAESVGNG